MAIGLLSLSSSTGFPSSSVDCLLPRIFRLLTYSSRISTPFPPHIFHFGNIRPGRPSASVGDSSSYPSSPEIPSLSHICNTLELCFFEVCIRNLGRPAGLALHGFVFAVVEAFIHGYTREQLSLELAFGSERMNEFEIGAAGSRLTSMEEYYRLKWLETIYITLHLLNGSDDNASILAIGYDAQLYSTIRHVLDGQITGDEQRFINFDRGLATKGASGGLVAKNVVISPQLVPVSQLVLLTSKVVNEIKRQFRD